MCEGNSLHESLEEALLSAVWRQWAALDSPAGERRPARAIVDPEALVLASLTLVERERRLWDLLSWWARSSSRLLSVQRVKNLASAYDGDLTARLGEFAHVALEEGSDARWKSFQRTASRFQARSSKLEASGPVLHRSPTLMLLLRRGMGVGIKPDLLAVLIGGNGKPQDVKSLSRATRYSSRAVRRAGEEMVEGRLIRVAQESPLMFSADAASWLAVLELEPPPPAWVPWHQVFTLCERLTTVLARLEADGGRYAASSSLRDLVEAYSDTFRIVNLRVPDPTRYRGEEYLEPFLQFIPEFRAWLGAAV